MARVADDDQAAVGTDRLDQPGHHRQGDHRGLVDDDDVVRQALAAVMAEAALASRAPAEQAVQSRRGEGDQRGADRIGDRERRRLGMDRFLESGRGLAGGGGEGDQRGRQAGGRSLLEQQRDDSGDRGGLAGARAAGDDGEAAEHGGRGGERLAAADLVGEQAVETVAQRVDRDIRCRRSRQAAQVGGDAALLLPVAIQIQQALVDQAQRPDLRRRRRLAHCDQRRRGDSGEPRVDRWPGELRQIDCLLGVDGRGVADRREIDVDVAQSRRADGECGGKRDVRRRLASKKSEPRCDMYVGRREHAGHVEVAQRAKRAQGAARIKRIDLDAGHGACPSSRSLKATTSAEGGRQANTPEGDPSTTGVAAPYIPRTNR